LGDACHSVVVGQRRVPIQNGQEPVRLVLPRLLGLRGVRRGGGLAARNALAQSAHHVLAVLPSGLLADWATRVVVE
jgi:hypothetical protein